MTDCSDKIREAFRFQAIPCRDLGSPFTARLCELVAERLTTDNAVGARVLSWPGNATAFGDSVPLRFAGALNAVVIEGLSVELKSVYPPDHKGVDDDRLWQAIENALVDHEGFIQERLNSAPQTNEVRRSSILLPGFWTIANIVSLPLVLSELGASAGLNLNFDRFCYSLGDRSWGDEKSTVRLSAELKGNRVEQANLTVRERAGCDLNPLNPANSEEMNRLLSYIWPDQRERVLLTHAAIDIAARSGNSVEKSDAIDWLRIRLQQRHEGAVHVIYHTIAWQYFPEPVQKEGQELIETAGDAATTDAPLAWLRFETDSKSPGAGLYLTLWPDGKEIYLARGDFHGRWVDWLA